MQSLLWLVVLMPFIGSLILAVFGAFMPKKTAGVIACAAIGLSWIMAMMILGSLSHEHSVVSAVAYPWINLTGFIVQMGLRVDALSAVMMIVVSFVAFLIHLYAAQSMFEEDGYSRFLAYMNLFVGSMLVLVLADNLLLLYLGWEGVGLCSYLLIGFWYKEKKNGSAAQKAFIVTRVGDTALAVGMFIIYIHLHTFNIQDILTMAPQVWAVGGVTITTVAIMIIGGAIGKSGQLPLHVWLPDAMAGPTPVSALIHAATMVTAGVYLIARLNPLFQMAPVAQMLVAIIGAATLLYAGFCALVQTDIKRVLAYSTISQIGYMFLALGLGAWTAAIFHLVTHAFFKALLFLSAGIVIDALHHEHNIFKMGGLRTKLPVAFWTFLIGVASLSALPLVTAGFYSKDAIIYASWASTYGSVWFWLAAVVGALITAAYSFRVFFLAFLGDQNHKIDKLPGGLMKLVVSVLAFFAIVAGFIGIPKALGGFEPFEEFMSSVFKPLQLSPDKSSLSMQVVLMLVSAAVTLFGIYLAHIYFKKRALSEAVAHSSIMSRIHSFLLSGMGFDLLYDTLLVKPFKALAYGNKDDVLDGLPTGLAGIAAFGNRIMSALQTGRLRNYATGIILGVVILTTILLLRL